MMSTPNNPRARWLDQPNQDDRAQYADIVEEGLCFGTQLLDSFMSAGLSARENIALVSLLRHTIETVDPVPICIRSGMIDSAKTNLRALLDTWLAVLYITKADTERRAKSYLYVDALEQVKRMRRFDPETLEGKHYAALLNKDRILWAERKKVPPDIVEFRNQLRSLEAHFGGDFYKGIHEEYARVKKIKKHPNWYSLFDGPDNIEQLANLLNVPAVYETFFRRYSGKVHPSAVISENVAVRADGSLALKPIRRSGSAPEVVPLCVKLLIDIYRSINTKCSLMPSDVLEAWAKSLLNELTDIPSWKLAKGQAMTGKGR